VYYWRRTGMKIKITGYNQIEREFLYLGAINTLEGFYDSTYFVWWSGGEIYCVSRGKSQFYHASKTMRESEMWKRESRFLIKWAPALSTSDSELQNHLNSNACLNGVNSYRSVMNLPFLKHISYLRYDNSLH